MPTVSASKQRESVYSAFVAALSRRDLDQLAALAADTIELRSYGGGPELVRGNAALLAAVEASRERIYDPALHEFRHLGDGFMIVSGRLRYSAEGGGVSDSSKAALARVVGRQVQLSLGFSSVAEAEAEHRARLLGS
jgi:hypothetical protein